MKKYQYEIYQLGKLPALTVLTADRYELDMTFGLVRFFLGKTVVGCFVQNNIAGFKIINFVGGDAE